MRAPSATVVSAQRIGAGAQPARAQAPRRGAQLGARDALDVGLGRLAGARRLERFDVLVGVGDSSSWRTPIWASSSRRRGLCEAR